jgi:hypothetical protein
LCVVVDTKSSGGEGGAGASSSSAQDGVGVADFTATDFMDLATQLGV